MRRMTSLLMLAAAGSLLVACHKHAEQPDDNLTTATPEPAAPSPTPTPTPTPKPKAPPKIAAAKVKAAPEPTADQQMQDDADATGMTSHVSRDADGSDTAGNSQQ